MILPTYRPTYAQIDLKAITHNIVSLRKVLPDETNIIAVVKADAYGHGVEAVSKAALAAGATMLAVATPDEAIELRNLGFQADILVLGASPVSFANIAAQQNIILTVFQAEWINEVQELVKPLRIHLKIDTGMGRLGIRSELELTEILQVLKRRPTIQVEGVYTHFATADEEDTQKFDQQLETFQYMLRLFPTPVPFIHASNSAASITKKNAIFQGVRYGIAMYGLPASNYVKETMPFEMKPALSLHTQLVHVKKVSEGSTISYGATYTAPKDEWIGTIPIGYADGVLRGLSGQEVLIQGKRMPIIGRICMDQCMILLDKSYPINEPVTLIGQQGNETIEIDEWAKKLNTISYEIPCLLTKRVPRVLKNN
ncbi:alanine racemase [Paenisporosarcina cavernae]|uniref:Alanine racemase n=1 Tax=Paenisporosarcina cavernae TaxID=2320858 RepID=A0A385YU10_9BACL|nr:alanine racemase [Paenisporosarcina cavernae]AYC30365.1 alanine racemase [Paenisporosarcina cavernae]